MSTPPPPDSFLTLAGCGEAETRVQRSRFIARTTPAAEEEAVRALVDEMTRDYHDARHVCWASRLGAAPTLEARTDAGEPAGTAGAPILTALRQTGVVDAVCVVVRYFGGVKLGTGGLARAYGEAAGLALAAASLRTVLQGRLVELVFPYPLQKTVRHLLESHNGQVRGEDYAAEVTWQVWLPHSRRESYLSALVEATADSVIATDRGDGTA